MQSLDCQLCYSGEETLDHLLASCSTARLVTAFMVTWLEWWPANEVSAQGIWSSLCRGDGGAGRSKEVKKVIGAAFLWTMWNVRNNIVFNGVMLKEKEIYEKIRFLAFDWYRSRWRFGNSLSWDLWSCNLVMAVDLCTSLAPR